MPGPLPFLDRSSGSWRAKQHRHCVGEWQLSTAGYAIVGVPSPECWSCEAPGDAVDAVGQGPARASRQRGTPRL